MIVSRGVGLCRRVLVDINKRKINPPIRNSGGWAYRTAPSVPQSHHYLAEGVGAFMWWWILWHLWYEPEHLTGEFPYPDPSKWTNEELGIPDDDDGEIGLLTKED